MSLRTIFILFCVILNTSSVFSMQRSGMQLYDSMPSHYDANSGVLMYFDEISGQPILAIHAPTNQLLFYYDRQRQATIVPPPVQQQSGYFSSLIGAMQGMVSSFGEFIFSPATQDVEQVVASHHLRSHRSSDAPTVSRNNNNNNNDNNHVLHQQVDQIPSPSLGADVVAILSGESPPTGLSSSSIPTSSAQISRDSQSAGHQCPICLELFTQDDNVSILSKDFGQCNCTQLQNAYHPTCLALSLASDSRCPVCRKNVVVSGQNKPLEVPFSLICDEIGASDQPVVQLERLVPQSSEVIASSQQEPTQATPSQSEPFDQQVEEIIRGLIQDITVKQVARPKPSVKVQTSGRNQPKAHNNEKIEPGIKKKTKGRIKREEKRSLPSPKQESNSDVIQAPACEQHDSTVQQRHLQQQAGPCVRVKPISASIDEIRSCNHSCCALCNALFQPGDRVLHFDASHCGKLAHSNPNFWVCHERCIENVRGYDDSCVHCGTHPEIKYAPTLLFLIHNTPQQIVQHIPQQSYEIKDTVAEKMIMDDSD